MYLANDFDILGIECTSDSRQIKRAYAKKVKLCSPEEDASNFQLLREAYERTLKYAEQARLIEPETNENKIAAYVQENEIKDITNITGIMLQEGIVSKNGDAFREGETFQRNCVAEKGGFSENSLALDDELLADIYDDTANIDHNKENEDNEAEYHQYLISDFFHKVHTIYADRNKRNDLAVWTQLTEHEALWKLQDRQVIRKMFLEEVAEGHFLDRKIILLMNEHFLWEDEEDEFFEEYYGGFVKYISECIKNEIVPGYEYLKPDMGFNIDEFVQFREYGYFHFLESDWENAFLNYNKAYEIFSGEPYLLCQIGMLKIKQNKVSEGRKLMEQGINTAAEPDVMKLFCGRMALYIENYVASNDYYRRIGHESVYYNNALISMTKNICKKKKYFRCYLMLADKMKKESREDVIRNSMRILYYEMFDVWTEKPRSIRMWYALRKLFYQVDGEGRNPFKVSQMLIKCVGKPLLMLCLYLLVVLFILSSARGLAILFWISYRVVKGIFKKKKNE